MTYTPRLTILFAATLALTTAACGDNIGADSDGDGRYIDDVGQSFELEEIAVDVAESCVFAQVDFGRVQAEIAREEYGRVQAEITGEAFWTTTNANGARPDELAPAGPARAQAAFCDVSQPLDAEPGADQLAPAKDDSVCGCDSQGCVAEAVTTSFGCDVCATFDCGNFDRHACVLCDRDTLDQ